LSLADQIRAAVEPRIIDRDYLMQLASEVERMEQQHAALTAAWDEIQSAGAKPAQIIARLRNVDPGPTPADGGTPSSVILRDDSTIEIEGVEHPIPARHSRGGRIAPLRIGQAIAAAGYRPVGDYYDALGVDGPDSIAVERA
jgi:hypothetical protein